MNTKRPQYGGRPAFAEVKVEELSPSDDVAAHAKNPALVRPRPRQHLTSCYRPDPLEAVVEEVAFRPFTTLMPLADRECRGRSRWSWRPARTAALASHV